MTIEDDGFITLHWFPQPEEQLELFPYTPLTHAQELDLLTWRAVLELPFTVEDHDRMRKLQSLIIDRAAGR